MALVGKFPETGFRIALKRVSTEPIAYEGRFSIPGEECALRVMPTDGVVEIDEAFSAYAEKVKRLVRAACRGTVPPPTIERWRPD